MEKRGDGELELAGVRVGGGGVLGVWGRELARERGDWNAGVPLVLKHAREWVTGALPRACHGGGDVAAAHTAGAAWRGKEGSSAGGSGARGLRECRLWRWSSRRWPPCLPERQRRCSAPVTEAAERERGGGGRRQAGLVCKFRKV